MPNIRTKGAGGEREICDKLNELYKELYAEMNLEFPDKPIAQRNQNQSAVGGDDISNTCNVSIEVKRHETLQINTWWKQCLISAAETNKVPVLLYRQSRQKWKVVTFAMPYKTYEAEATVWARVEMSFDDFLVWFKNHARVYIEQYGSPR